MRDGARALEPEGGTACDDEGLPGNGFRVGPKAEAPRTGDAVRGAANEPRRPYGVVELWRTGWPGAPIDDPVGAIATGLRTTSSQYSDWALVGAAPFW